MGARLDLDSACLLLCSKALPLVLVLRANSSIFCRAARLPLAEHMQGESAKDRTELSLLAVRILVHNHVDLKHLAHSVPEVGGLVEPPVVEEIEDL